jgi:hypothetical protein
MVPVAMPPAKSARAKERVTMIVSMMKLGVHDTQKREDNQSDGADEKKR